VESGDDADDGSAAQVPVDEALSDATETDLAPDA
jgi:hypothetical protein